MPWFWDLVQLSTEIPLQLSVSTTLLKQSHNYVFHNNPQHLNFHAWCLGVDSSKNKASLWRWQRELLHLRGHQQGPSTSQSGPYLRNGAEKNLVDFSAPSVKQISDFFMYLYQDLNRRPSTIDGYRTGEIHARVAKKVSNLGQWVQVALFPSSDFIAKNQLAREGSPVTIPAFTTIVDWQFKEDRTRCPVRALRYYLDRTKDLRGSRSLLFISFKKGHTSDIRPATLSSWLKQTILLCYKQADQQALDLVQIKAHDIWAFAASKAFYGGVSVDQIMQACHWKAHNTFTNFYLKDLTWSDNVNNLYLGPVVAAHQVLDPSPQTCHHWEEKKGGGGTSTATKSSGVWSQGLGIACSL